MNSKIRVQLDFEKLKKVPFDENSKALVLGLKLMNVVGNHVNTNSFLVQL